MPPELQGFLGGITLADILIWFVGIGAIWAGIKWVAPFVRKTTDFFDDVAGEPARPGVPARPGLMERLAAVEENQKRQGQVIETVRHELFPNSGKSLRDQTNRMEEKLDRDNDRISELAGQLDQHITQSTKIIESLKEKK